MAYLSLLAAKMEANGTGKHAAGTNGYGNWVVTVSDVLQWIGVWMYILAFPQQGGRDSYFSDPEAGFGPRHDMKKWLKQGYGGERGIKWFQQMQSCFELPTYGLPCDPFNKTRKFWDALRDTF